jgi:anaerobic C4-dicarboxylate transporter
LYSQAIITKTLISTTILLGIEPITLIASFVTVGALFVSPAYPTLLTAVQMGNTESARIGNMYSIISFYFREY